MPSKASVMPSALVLNCSYSSVNCAAALPDQSVPNNGPSWPLSTVCWPRTSAAVRMQVLPKLVSCCGVTLNTDTGPPLRSLDKCRRTYAVTHLFDRLEADLWISLSRRQVIHRFGMGLF